MRLGVPSKTHPRACSGYGQDKPKRCISWPALARRRLVLVDCESLLAVGDRPRFVPREVESRALMWSRCGLPLGDGTERRRVRIRWATAGVEGGRGGARRGWWSASRSVTELVLG